MASGNMDAGFNKNLNWNVGGPNRFKAPGPDQNQLEGRGLDKGPRDEVNFGSLPLEQAAPDLRETGTPESTGLIAGNVPVNKTESFSAPGLLDINTIGGIDTKSFGNVGASLTAVNGVNSTVIYDVGGSIIASANPLNPVTLVNVPTTSIGTNGLESTELVTNSGRVISLNDTVSVRMPTTSVDLVNGLDSTEFFTYNGNVIKV